VVVVENCSRPDQRILRLTLADLAHGLDTAHGPVLVMIGEACSALDASVQGLDLLTTAGMADLLAAVFNYSAELALVLDLLAGCGDTAAAEAARAQAASLVRSAEARACVEAELAAPGATLDAMVELQNSVTE
jgi:hypothetical protein